MFDDLYLSFNRVDGINRDSDENKDRVVIHKGSLVGPSYILAVLDEDSPEFVMQQYDNKLGASVLALIIKVANIDIAKIDRKPFDERAPPDVATVRIRLDNPSNRNFLPNPLP